MTRTGYSKTFRLENEASNLLEQQARDRNVSANAVINDLILKNLKLERGLRSIKTIRVASLTMRLLTEGISDEKMAEIGRKMADDVLLRDIPLEVSGTMTPESILETMKLLGEVNVSEIDGRKVVFLAHYSGTKWSVLMGTFLKQLFASAGASVKFSLDDNSVVFEL